MAILNNSNAISSGSYDINNSLRFRSSASAYLNRTPSSTTNRQTFTWSGWVKRGTLGARQHIFVSANPVVNTVGQQEFQIALDSSNVIQLVGGVSGVGNDFELVTTQVFRDPSAWYHIVVAVDTTQATAANRMKLYINGVQVTAFSTATYPAQNYNTSVNLTGFSHRIGGSGGSYLDAYQAETNFIDGQALTPSSFGSTNATTGVWQPAKYTGTYGTNGFYLPFIMNNSTSSYAGSFNGSSQYLSSSTALFNYTTANAATQTATIEAMVYLNSYQTASQVYYSPAIAGKGDVYMNLGVNGSGNLIFYHYDGTARTITGSSVIPLNTWTYVAVTISGGTATIYVNGTSVGSGTWYGIQAAGQSSTSYFGRPATSGSALYLNGYISNLRVSSIARTISTPSAAYSNDANTNFLTLQSATVVDNSTNAYAITNTGTVTTSVSYPFYTTSVSADYSGNANNWTSNNIQVAVSSTTYDAMTDSPTLTSATVANYAVLNPLSKGTNVVLSQANLKYDDPTGGTGCGAFSTIGMTSGKFYCEATVTGTDVMVGLSSSQDGQIGYVGINATGWGYYSLDGKKYNNGSSSTYGATYTTNDVIGIAFDADAGTLTFYKNNTSQGTAFSSLTSGPYYFATGNGAGGTDGSLVFNFGQRPFSYTPPTGFKRLNTYNLPDSTIKKGNTVMDATTYTGNGSTQTITNAGAFKPDFVWIKRRDATASHALIDSVRGISSQLVSNLTNAEFTGATDGITSLNSNGFSLGAGTLGYVTNTNGATLVGWQWQAGQGSTSSNTSGTITSTVSVSTTAGFSVVTYTGTGANATVGHGLGVAPKMIIIKNRGIGTAGDGAWQVYHASLGNTQYLSLNTTAAAATATNRWNNTSPTSTVFTVATTGAVNDSGNTYVAYCWAEIAGFSKFGSYTGNGSTDGPFVYLGFRPKYVMVKPTSTTGSWQIEDTSRSPTNVMDQRLFAEDTAAETVNGNGLIDYLSNGFKPRVNHPGNNGSGVTYIYMAFAEVPTKFANAR
jgi:hypothetical protein